MYRGSARLWECHAEMTGTRLKPIPTECEKTAWLHAMDTVFENLPEKVGKHSVVDNLLSPGKNGIDRGSARLLQARYLRGAK